MRISSIFIAASAAVLLPNSAAMATMSHFDVGTERPEHISDFRFEKGLKLFDAGDYVAAEEQFRKIYPFEYSNASVNLMLGASLFMQKEYGRSVDYLEKSLAIKVNPLSSDMRDTAQKMLSTARK